MRFYKVDPELIQICDEVDLSEDELIGDYELGSSEELFIFSDSKLSSIWIDRRLMSNNIPLIRVNIKIVKDGIEYTIYPSASTLEGSIVLNSPHGNYRYNLIFKT